MNNEMMALILPYEQFFCGLREFQFLPRNTIVQCAYSKVMLLRKQSKHSVEKMARGQFSQHSDTHSIDFPHGSDRHG